MRGELLDEVPRQRRLVMLPRISGVGVVPEDHEPIVSQAVPRADVAPQKRALGEGLRSLANVFTRRALVMRSVPRVLQGPYTAAVRLSLQEASQAQQDGDQVRLSRAWKLFLLLPQMLLWTPPRGGLFPKRHLEGRLSLFVAGEWTALLQQGTVHGAAAAVAFARKRRREDSEKDLSRRAARAVRQVELGGTLSGQTSVGRIVCCTRYFENVEGSH